MSSASGKRVVELIDKLQNSEGYQIERIVVNLRISKYTVDKNFEELTKLIRDFETGVEIWAEKNRQHFEAGLWELSRLLQNYLSSIYTLIEHNIQLCENLDSEELNHLYGKQKNELLNWDCTRFVRDLRTFSQHVGLPLLMGQINLSKTEYKQSILLQRDELSKWHKWSEQSKKYMKAKRELELLKIVEEYQFLIGSFHEWLLQTILKIFQKQLNELPLIRKEIANLEVYRELKKD
jgi:hypothetical protein